MSAQVGAWVPAATLGAAHARVLDAAAEAAAETFADAEAAERLREVVGAEPGQLVALFEPQDSGRLIGWLKALVLAEEALAGCDAGPRSPAIRIARLLRARGDYPPGLTAWIKATSSNRFLPYGSLQDQLRG